MKEKAKVKVGGQALIEGVMMKKQNFVSMAVRKQNDEIYLKTFKINFLEKIKWYKKIPIFRGVVEMVISLIVGYKCLLKSAEKSQNIEKETEEKKSNILKIFNFFSILLGVFLTIVFFMFLPSFFVKNAAKLIFFNNNILKVFFEGIIKITIFLIYLILISNFKDVKRTFEYHGAEHKSIFCFEKGLKLTVENVKKQKRFHPRCGTNFIFIVFFISILTFSFLTWKNLIVRVLFKILMLPLITGISYEILKFAGNTQNKLIKILITPGLMLQRITTKEPDEKQIEIAIKALEEVLKN